MLTYLLRKLKCAMDISHVWCTYTDERTQKFWTQCVYCPQVKHD